MKSGALVNVNIQIRGDMILLDGKRVAEDLKNELKYKVQQFKEQFGEAPLLKVVIVGEDKASQVYVKNKHIACQKVGINSEILELPSHLTESQFLHQIEKLNEDPRIDGILVQLPLPKNLSSQMVFRTISPEKDADGMTYTSTGYLWSGLDHVKPCTPNGVIKILKYYQIPIAGQKALVIGRSQIVGKPMAALLLNENATVTVAHSGTKNLKEFTLANDIIIAAAGKPEFLTGEYFNSNAVVIDVGIHGTGTGKLCGDVEFSSVSKKVKAITPVPGGVGPMTIACLLENTLILAAKRRSK